MAALGRREDALAAITEAVDIYRELAAARPDAFRPDLATSLNNQSTALAELGRREDALAAITEAVDDLPGAGRGPPGRVPPRPRHVAEQPVASRWRSWAGARTRWPPSPRPSTIYRELAAARPDAFRPDLARSLNNQSHRVGGAGPARGRAGRHHRGRRRSTGSWPRPARTRSAPTSPGR